MTRWMILGLALTVAACGGDDGTQDGGCATGLTRNCKGAACFIASCEVLQVDVGGGAKGAPDLSCAAPTIETSAGDVAATGTLKDFQSGDAIAGGTVDVFYPGDSFDGAPRVTATSDGDGNLSFTFPGPAPSRVNYRNRSEDALDTYALNNEIDVSGATVTTDRETVSNATAAILPALIGIRRTEGLGILAGEALDCQDRVMENAIATVSSVSGAAPSHIEGQQVYYFRNDLPAGRNLQPDTNADGLFSVMEITPGEDYYLQVWGYPTEADLALGAEGLKLISEYKAPVKPDSVIIVSLNPTEGPF